MATPISALQRNASAVVRKVAASGISEEITDHGRVVGILSPPTGLTGLDRLRAQGAVREGNPQGFRAALEALANMRITGLREALDEQRDDGGR